MKYLILFLVFISLACAQLAQDLKCRELQAQETLDLTKLMGKWFVIEILEHRFKTTQAGLTSTIWSLDECPIIKLRSTGTGYLRLLWTEDSGNLDYTFQVEDYKKRPGIWRSIALQNGTLTEKSYTQFAGTVHVMKAVAQHLVLTFCTESSGNNLYSLILSRTHILAKTQIKGIHGLLERRELQTMSTRSTCAKGSATSFNKTIFQLIIYIIISLTFIFVF